MHHLPSITRLAAALTLAALPSPAPAADTAAAPPKEDGASVFARICADCHGQKAEGKKELHTPSIASMPHWYIQNQLRKFQSDIRGANPDDLTGLQMRAIAHSLDKNILEAVARHIESLPLAETRRTLKGDVTEGALVFEEVCMACHRYNASGELAFKSPQLYGLQDWYIAAQLKKFKSGARGVHEHDEEGAKMHEVTQYLTDQQIIDVATFLPSLADKYHRPKTKESTETK